MSVIPRSSQPHHIEELGRMLESDGMAMFLHPEDLDAMETLDKNYVGEL
jgi:hypothetical protein